MNQDKFISIIFFIYAGIAIFKPELIARFQTWANKKILGAQFKASKRTLRYYRGIGIIFATLATLLVFGVIN